MTDTTVHSGSVSIVVRDHGGVGPPVLLLHGLGGNLLTWEPVAPLLASSCRVLAVELRGHGKSGDGAWEWDAVLADLEAVVDRFGLASPAVVGHSLGGMLAGMWARRHPDCPAAVSLDGHRSAATHEENYAGLPAERVQRSLAELRSLFQAQLDMMSQPLGPEQVAALREQQRAQAARHGVDAQLLVAMAERGLATHHGQTWARPSAELAAAVQATPEFTDALPVFAQVTCPFLVVLAARNLPGLPAELLGLMDAHRAGLRRDLGALADRMPYLRLCELDATHGMVAEQPRQVASLLTAFILTSSVPTG